MLELLGVPIVRKLRFIGFLYKQTLRKMHLFICLIPARFHMTFCRDCGRHE
jgi:hypothetical protein